jgi:hypothetical protein
MTNKKIEQMAADLGVEIDWYLDNSGAAEAPKGKVFKATGTHCVAMVHSEPFAPSGKKSESLAGLLEDMQGGFEDCDEPDCEYCEEQEQLVGKAHAKETQENWENIGRE